MPNRIHLPNIHPAKPGRNTIEQVLAQMGRVSDARIVALDSTPNGKISESEFGALMERLKNAPNPAAPSKRMDFQKLRRSMKDPERLDMVIMSVAPSAASGNSIDVTGLQRAVRAKHKEMLTSLSAKQGDAIAAFAVMTAAMLLPDHAFAFAMGRA